MKVQATKAGFYAGKRIREGEVFTLPEGAKPGKWMASVKDAAPVPAKAKEEGPKTLSAMGKQDAKRDAKANGQNASDLV